MKKKNEPVPLTLIDHNADELLAAVQSIEAKCTEWKSAIGEDDYKAGRVDLLIRILRVSMFACDRVFASLPEADRLHWKVMRILAMAGAQEQFRGIKSGRATANRPQKKVERQKELQKVSDIWNEAKSNPGDDINLEKILQRITNKTGMGRSTVIRRLQTLGLVNRRNQRK